MEKLYADLKHILCPAVSMLGILKLGLVTYCMFSFVKFSIISFYLSGPLSGPSTLIGWGACCFLSFMSVHEEFETTAVSRFTSSLLIPPLPTTVFFIKKACLHIYHQHDEVTWLRISLIWRDRMWDAGRDLTGWEGLWCLFSESLLKLLSWPVSSSQLRNSSFFFLLVWKFAFLWCHKKILRMPKVIRIGPQMLRHQTVTEPFEWQTESILRFSHPVKEIKL